MSQRVLYRGPSFDHNVKIRNASKATAGGPFPDRRSDDAWQLFNLLNRFFKESPAMRLIRVPRLGKFHGHCEQVRSVESRLDRIKEHEASEHQPRARQQHNGECELQGDQQSARAANACAVRSASSAFI